MTHELPALAAFTDVHNPNVPGEAFFSLNANPNLILSAHQQDHLYVPSPTSMVQSFGHRDFKFIQPNVCNVDLAHLPPPIIPPPPNNSSSIDPTWSLPYLPQSLDPNHEDLVLRNGAGPHYIGEKVVADQSIAIAPYDSQAMVPMMPRLCEIIEGNVCSMASSSASQDPMIPKLCEIIQGNVCSLASSSATQEIDPLARFTCFPSSGPYPHDPQMPTNQMEYMDAIMSSLPSSSSSSLLPAFSNGQFVANPNLPSTWEA